MTDNTKSPEWIDPCAGYREPIARNGEQQFACIVRNRSGIDAGSIDFGARFIDGLNAHDQQAAIESAYSIYLKWCDETGLRSIRDTHPSVDAPGVVVDEALPELPETIWLDSLVGRLYTADQMREYGRDAITAALAPKPEGGHG